MTKWIIYFKTIDEDGNVSEEKSKMIEAYTAIQAISELSLKLRDERLELKLIDIYQGKINDG